MNGSIEHILGNVRERKRGHRATHAGLAGLSVVGGVWRRTSNRHATAHTHCNGRRSIAIFHQYTISNDYSLCNKRIGLRVDAPSHPRSG